MNTEPDAVVQEFWRLMASNEFNSVKGVLATEFVMGWQLSKERIEGTKNFARMNSEYPTNGSWEFTINRLVNKGNTVVSQVSLTEGTQPAEPISFFTIEQRKITHLVEYWLEPFEPNINRKHLVEKLP